MRDPRDLEVIELSMTLAELTYLLTKEFPLDERFGLVAQMRRAAVSIGSNIAEGCGRTTDRAFVSFLQIALGSALELDYQAQLAERLGHGNAQRLQELRGEVDRMKRKLVSFMNAIRRRKVAATPVRQREAPAAP